MVKPQTLQEAVEQVRRNNSEDYTRLYGFACDWVKANFKPFTSEDIKKAFYEAKNDPPRNLNVFGAVIRTMSQEGLIFENGAVTAKEKPAKNRLLRLWISREYKQKQSENAKGDKLTLKLEL